MEGLIFGILRSQSYEPITSGQIGKKKLEEGHCHGNSEKKSSEAFTAIK